MCSGNPAAPLPTVPSITAQIGDHWAVLAFCVAPLGIGPFHFLPGDPGLTAVSHSCSIFHPPRIQAACSTS
jgi:hypothetical protein